MLLNRELEKEWLNPDLAEDHIKEIFNFKYEDSSLQAYPVSKGINSNKNHLDNEEVMEPAEYDVLRPFFRELENFH